MGCGVMGVLSSLASDAYPVGRGDIAHFPASTTSRTATTLLHPLAVPATITTIKRDCYRAAARPVDKAGLPNELVVISKPNRDPVSMGSREDWKR